MMVFKKDDRVRIAGCYLKAQLKNTRVKRDWQTRTGQVVALGVGGVAVLWEGRVSLDYYAPQALQLAVTDASDPAAS